MRNTICNESSLHPTSCNREEGGGGGGKERGRRRKNEEGEVLRREGRGEGKEGGGDGI